MALPRVNELPLYDVTIPSSGVKTRFRPYLVKEEKTLMMAFETGSHEAGLNAVVDTINSCLDKPIPKDKLTTFDVEYLLLKIRSKSVGEKIDLKTNCKECEHTNDVTVNIDDIQMQGEKQDNVIKLTDEISVEMKYPSYTSVLNINPENPSVEDTFNVLSLCIDAILTEEERILAKDESIEELLSFLDSLTTEQFLKLSDFINGMPKLQHDINFTCTKCEKENNLHVEGIQNFFT
jgi:ribosomal protein L44E